MSTQTKTQTNGNTTALEDRSLMDDRLLDTLKDDDQTFTVRSQQDAEKAFRAMKAAEAKKDQLQQEMEAHIQEIKDFYEPKIERQEESIEFLKGRITSFVESTGESVSTPSGKAHTTSRTKRNWGDEDAIEAFARKHVPEAVTTETKVSKRALWDAIKEREDVPANVASPEQVTTVRCYTT